MLVFHVLTTLSVWHGHSVTKVDVEFIKDGRFNTIRIIVNTRVSMYMKILLQPTVNSFEENKTISHLGMTHWTEMVKLRILFVSSVGRYISSHFASILNYTTYLVTS